MNRREFFTTASTAAMGVITQSWLRAATPEPVVVETSQGRLRGMRSGDTVAFLGVPFAEPPAGPLRFLAPQAARSWSGVRAADTMAPAPVQLRRARTSEDCLYLNVWMPAAPGPHPVLVWIYGGGNTAGATGGIADGSHFARNGVVCVTPAYRVGALGFLDLSEELGEAYAGSGNNGLRDQILALRWVRENITAFGGDPERVTIGGESAGAKDTCALMAAHEAEGLFRQAIMESGSGQTVYTRDGARALTHDFLQCAGLDAAHADALRTMPVDRLLQAQRALIARRGSFPFRGTVDGVVLEHSPVQAIRAGASRHVRLLLGSNRDESSFFVRGTALEQPIGPRELQNADMDRMRAMEAKYKEAFPHLTPAQRKVRLLTAEEYWIPTVRVAEAHAAQEGETWLYRFDYPFAKGPLAGEVPHTAELSFVWGDSNGNADHDALMRAVHDAWIGFLFGRAPSLSGAPAWPRFTVTERAVMVIDRRSEVARDPDAIERRLWDGWPS